METKKQFCGECGRVVETCVHFEKAPSIPELRRVPHTDEDLLKMMSFANDRGVPIATDFVRSMGTGLELAPEPNDIQSAAKRVRGDELRTSRGFLPFMAFKIPARTRANVDAQPQAVFGPLRLIYAGKKETFLLQNLSVGKNSQFAASGSVPMESFPPHPPEGKAIDNLEGVDTCQVAMQLRLTVENITDEPQDFYAVMYGKIA